MNKYSSDMKKQINDLLLKMQTGENCIGETANELLNLFSVSFSLRDEIAMNELNGLYASHANPQAGSPIHTDISKSAEHCYKIADAMIKARSNES